MEEEKEEEEAVKAEKRSGVGEVKWYIVQHRFNANINM